MSSEARGSVTHWIGDLKAGDPEAVAPLWRRYSASLVGLARTVLLASRARPGVEDEEDAALSAFDSFCAGSAAGRFDGISDRQDLWRILVVITARKAKDQVRRQRRLKRGGGRVIDEAALAGPAAGGEGGAALDRIVAREPTPEFAAMFAEEVQNRLAQLGDETLRRIVLWRMEGYSKDEIAAKLGCVTRSVERKLNLIRQAWLGEEP
jgi:DNA-directed RNA polymerase specialized sigma24 family protein